MPGRDESFPGAGSLASNSVPEAPRGAARNGAKHEKIPFKALLPFLQPLGSKSDRPVPLVDGLGCRACGVYGPTGTAPSSIGPCDLVIVKGWSGPRFPSLAFRPDTKSAAADRVSEENIASPDQARWLNVQNDEDQYRYGERNAQGEKRIAANGFAAAARIRVRTTHARVLRFICCILPPFSMKITETCIPSAAAVNLDGRTEW